MACGSVSGVKLRVSTKWVVLCSLWLSTLVRQPTAPVRVRGGLLRGALAHDGSHAAYLAVPYATPVNRFQAPGPEPTWEGVFEAIEENVRCPQRVGDSYLIGRENCLTLNVYTPLNASPEDRLPVMVYIHGGGFFSGSGSKFLYGPDYIVPKGVILVTINYRLNIQGFLCLRTKDAPGNAGLKDQVAALKWVQKNIRAFGGDSDNVTIFGESAGGASVSYHVLSKMSQGLFHKAITQSGSSLCPWAFQYQPIYKASLLAKVMLHNTQDPHDLYNYFKDKTDRELVITRVPRKEGNLVVSELLYVPCAENLIDGEDPFLTEHPYDLLVKGEFNKVPMMIGMNDEEGYLFAAMENDTTIPKISFEKSLPKDLIFPTENDRQKAADDLKKMYLGDLEISKETMLNVSKLHGELYFQYPVFQETELLSKASTKPVYSYMLSYSGFRNLAKGSSGKPYKDVPGATHADDLFYLFKQTLLPSFFEYTMIDRMTTMWTNFAKYGDPTPVLTELLPMKWLPSSAKNQTMLRIDENFSTMEHWYTETLVYWKQLYDRYRRTKD